MEMQSALAASLRPAAALWRSLSRAPPRAWPAPAAPRGGAPRRAAPPPPSFAARASAAAAGGASSAAPTPPPPEVMDLPLTLRLHNTLTRAKEPFRPAPPPPGAPRPTATLYVCGVTAYDLSHVGHARAYVAFDVLYRVLAAAGHDVRYARNFTDVDDKIIARAAANNEDPGALAERMAVEFHADMDALGCARPSAEPRATAYVPAMVAAIERIVAHGHAYAAGGGDVFFEVGSLPGYGALSGRGGAESAAAAGDRAGERVAVDARKRGPQDFALWKGAKAGEPAWDSPWGRGRPGWHIECSAMIGELFGPAGVDVHGGGADLVFPHHENELAQARAAAAPCGCGADHSGGGAAAPLISFDPADVEARPLARYWLHNGFVNVDAEKMSKSLGNFFTIRDVLGRYRPAALRWFLLGTQYRAPVNYTQRALEEASDRVYYLYQAVADVDAALAAAGAEGAAAAVVGEADARRAAAAPGWLADALAALADDLNTPGAAAALSAPLKAANDLLHTKAGRKAPGRLAELGALRAGLRLALGLLGLWPDDAAAELGALRAAALVRAGLTDADVAAALAERAAARAAKDWAASDAVRDCLAAAGVAIMDGPGGTEWRPAPRLEAAAEERAAAGAAGA
jgi:cysteinyl-tRNA synthetase